MGKYNELNGVPIGYYYLVQILCFADFETPEQTRILVISKDKTELEDFCRGKGYALTGDWCEYQIKLHKE